MIWSCLIGNLRESLPTPWLQIILALTSVICGAVVGMERERREKPAGLRTLMLVCLGSTIFTMASFIFTSTTGDSGRVAAQIVTGIGFLGAGAILHGTGVIRGMTTAAIIWAIAATGMIVGIGYAGAGLGLSVLVRLVLSVALALEIRALGNVLEFRIELVFDPNGGKARARIEKIMEDYHLGDPLAAGEVAPDGTVRVSLKCRLPRQHHREFMNDLANLPEVKVLKELAA
jgi:putative Mg2+ transporter-C (MgtC) family protein